MPARRARGRAGAHARATVERLRLRTLVLLGGLAVGTAYIGRTFGLHDPIYLTSEITLLLAILIVTHSIIPLVERHERGATGEETVGALLDGLQGLGWRVLHDLSFGNGNVDHLLIGPGGVFTVETKSHPGPIAVRSIHGGTLEQARAEQRALERITGEEVEALLVYSRAWVDRPLARRRGVRVLPASMLLRYLAGREASIDGASEATLLPEHLRSVHETVLSAVARRRSATCEECSGHPPSAVRRGLTLEISAVRRARLSRRLGWRG
jgi:hypothetical protein